MSVLLIGYSGMHSRNNSQIADALSFPYLHNSCNGFLPFKLTASASILDSVNKARTTFKCPSRTAM